MYRNVHYTEGIFFTLHITSDSLQLDREARNRRIIDLRSKGHSYRKIANLVGNISHTHVAKICKDYTDRVEVKNTSVPSSKSQTSTPSSNISLQDTRHMSWQDWSLEYLNITLLESQIQTLLDMERYNRFLKNRARRTGKTTIIIKIFMLRKLCESQFEDITQGVILYLSAIRDVVVEFLDEIEYILSNNSAIIESYGNLIDSDSRNTQTIINLTTRNNRSIPSMIGGTLASRWRGFGYKWVIIDDPIDVFHETELDSLTKKLVKTIHAKLSPIAKRGNICVLGTRYAINDVFSQLGTNSTSYYWHSEKTVESWGSYSIPPRNAPIKASEILIHNPDEWIVNDSVLWEEMPNDLEATAIQNIVWTKEEIGDREFQSEYQNTPTLLNPIIDYEKIKHITELNEGNADYKWCAFVDVAVSEKDGDYTAVTLTGMHNKQNYIYDMFFGKWSASSKYRKIEEEMHKWQDELGFRILLLVEVVQNNGAELYQWLRDETDLKVEAVNPKGRGAKVNRITTNLQEEIDTGRVSILDSCRYKEQLERECNGFPNSKDDHILDSLDQAVWYLKKKTVGVWRAK